MRSCFGNLQRLRMPMSSTSLLDLSYLFKLPPEGKKSWAQMWSKARELELQVLALLRLGPQLQVMEGQVLERQALPGLHALQSAAAPPSDAQRNCTVALSKHVAYAALTHRHHEQVRWRCVGSSVSVSNNHGREIR